MAAVGYGLPLACCEGSVTTGRVGFCVGGRVEILEGLKTADRVVAVGQLKLQSGAAVAISTDPAPPVPAQPSLN